MKITIKELRALVREGTQSPHRQDLIVALSTVATNGAAASEFSRILETGDLSPKQILELQHGLGQGVLASKRAYDILKQMTNEAPRNDERPRFPR